MENKLLYELEHKIGEIRKNKLNSVMYDNLTLKEVLDLGFNNTYIFVNDEIGYVKLYKDLENDYLLEDNLFTKEDILNSKVVYVSDDYSTSDFIDYLEITVDFENEEAKKMFLDYLEK